MELRKVEYTNQLDSLKIDCEQCFGLCCVGLYFSASEGFPRDKVPGDPCEQLGKDFRCQIHQQLREEGLKGCTAYDCFGAGQKIAQVTYGGQDWRNHKAVAQEMFDAFVVMRQLHEMLWYLNDALTFNCSATMQGKLQEMILETEKLTNLNGEQLLKVDVDGHRINVNTLLKQVVGLINQDIATNKQSNKSKKKLKPGYDFIGTDLAKTDLVGANLAGALLIAANLNGADLTGANVIGADLRDANIGNADLSQCLFLTQNQINAAKGNGTTRLPETLTRPFYWEK